jgi:NAD(P)-dependent dehydrogenase (short-subunit alcohol dehydrogenase family)
MSNRLQGKTALISGRLAANGSSAVYQHLDVRKRADWDAARDHAEREFGPVDVLVSNAFVIAQPALLDVTLAEWNSSLDVNLTGGFHGMRSLLPGMLDNRRGAIVVISATQGNELVVPSQAAYQTAKAGISALVRHVAMTYGPQGVRANAIHPGAIDTEMIGEEGMRPFAQAMAAGWPIPRLGEPDEIAQAAVFLASDESRFITGASLVVDGGPSLGLPLPQTGTSNANVR